MKNDKIDPKTKSEWRLHLILSRYLGPTIDFDNLINITELLKRLWGNPKWPPKMMKKWQKKNSKLWPILAGYLIPTMYFDNMIHITALMKTVRLRGPHKLPKTDVIDPEHYIANNDWNLWDFLACYLSQTMDFYMVHINAWKRMKTIGYRKPKITLLKYKKMLSLQVLH